MDRNTITGFVLIAGILLAMQYFNQPSEAEINREEFLRDSIRQEQVRMDSIVNAKAEGTATAQIDAIDSLPDSLKVAALSGDFGAFAGAASGTAEEVTIENDVMTLTFSTKGGHIIDAQLKDYEKWSKDTAGTIIKEPLHIMEDKKNKFEYVIPITGANRRAIKTSELYFTPTVNGNKVSFKANAGSGYIEQVYTLKDGDYMMDYDLNLVGLARTIPTDVKTFELNWHNYLDKVELNADYEKMYSSAYYKEVNEEPDHCSCTSDDEILPESKVQWVSHTQQFFNTTLVSESNFESAILETVDLGEDNTDLKLLKTKAYLAYDGDASANYDMQMYIGPNDFDRLKAYDMELEEIIPFGWGIFRAVNKWIIRPIFQFLSSFIGSAGLVILLLTFLVKLALYPLTYKMLHSQAKMAALKPEMEKLRKKFGEDQQQMQMKTMEMYRASGVNPLGGCWPMVLQMPIWYALFRFFPGSIDFRQESFLWAHDLSTYDSVLEWSQYIPLISGIYGNHVSLFTILWAGTTVLYSYYNMQNMQMPTQQGMNANMMKYMQYLMPVMFLFFFNSYAAGLTVYMLFSNVFNIAQTLITKNFIINKDKVLAGLDKNRKKPKKKGGFGERLQKALAEQQEVAKQQQANKKKK